ncbi:MAG: hypothetical protein IJS59_04705 [Bacteroidaceae bacterium]|nr:hypothetical protein [Bacteroidaceae bacterium]
MKKFLLSLVALVVGTTAWADATVTLDFTSQTNWDIPTSGTNKDEAEFTDGTTTIKLSSTNNYRLNSGYLILGKANSYLEFPAFDFDVEKIEIVGTSGASASVVQNIYVGETAVSTETTGAQGVTNSYEIDADYQAAGNIYKLVVTSAHNTQIAKIFIYAKGDAATIAKPTISPATGYYTEPQEVTITSTVDGATIKYSFGEDEFIYTGAFTVSETTTVEAWVETADARSDISRVKLTFPCTSISAINAAATPTREDAGIVFEDLLVTYVNGSYNYLTDGVSGLLVYGSNTGLKAGDRISGSITGKLYTYNGLPELTNPTLSVEVLSEGNEVAPIVITSAQLVADRMKYANMFVQFDKVSFEEAVSREEGAATGDNIPFVADDVTLQLRNQFKLAIDAAAEQFYTLTGFISIYNDDTQVLLLGLSDYSEPVAASFADGEYILANVGSGLFWGAGNNWGTRASLIEHPDYVILHPQAEAGVYQLESQVSNGGNNKYFNGDYMDNDSPINLVITRVGETDAITPGGSPVYAYTIATAEGQYFGYDGQTTVLGKGLTADDARARWVICTVDEAKAALATATADEPADATFLIHNPNFGRNNRWGKNLSTKNDQVKNADFDAVWTFDASNKDVAGDNSNYCLESYHAVFTLSQVLTDVPNGIYSLTAQGFYRQDGTDEVNLPVFYANDETALFPVKTGTENSMTNASASFSQGLYTIDPIFFEVTDGQITLGARLETNTGLWCIWDNFVLQYYGTDGDIAQLKFSAKLEQIATLRQQLETLNADVTQQTVNARNAELIATEVGSTEAEIDAVIAALTAAVAEARGYINAAAVLPQMKTLTESTNFYTAEALNTYYTQWQAKYDAGTLTAEEALALQNPFTTTGWHAAITCDDFLLSAWDTNPDFIDAPYYINTWSVEGKSDGTDFNTPFFEYFVADGESLGEKTLTATLTGLTPGTYNISAWVRVRAKNGVAATDATGITLSATGGEAVDVTEGDAVGTSQFNIGQYTATGIVGDDGELKATFTVAADNNISWLSFQNVKYEAVVPTYAITIAETANGTIAIADDKSEAQEGETITVTATPADGYELQAITVATTEGAPVAVTTANDATTFIMPASAVTVSATFVEQAQPENDYERALLAITDGGTYRIFTEVGESKYYLNTIGYLVADELKAATFTFTAVQADGTLYETGWNLGCKFTNPTLSGGSSGDVVNDGHIHVGDNNRDNWERQVFLRNTDGLYAVRATNANSANWGANTFWDVINDAEMPQAGYSLTESYVWQIESFVDERPAAFAKVQSWPAKLQAIEGLVTDASQWTTNAQESSEGPIRNLIDGNTGSFFHSQWSGTGPDESHYIEATLPEAAQKLNIAFIKRNDNNRPTRIIVSGDGSEQVQILTEGLPAAAWYGASIDLGAAVSTLRFTVTNTNTNDANSANGLNNGHVYFTFGEFYILSSNELTDAAIAYMTAGDYTELSYDAIDAINAIDEQISNAAIQKALENELNDMKTLATKLETIIAATDTYQDPEELVSTISTDLEGIKTAAYTSSEAIAEAKQGIVELGQEFFSVITPLIDMDVTEWFIANPTPTANADGWTVQQGTAVNQWAGNTYDADNNVAEFWNYSGSSISQTVELPAGNFELTAQAFTRTDMIGVLAAGEETVNIVTVDEAVNTRAQAGTWFTNGNGVNTLPFTMAEAGNITISLTTDNTTGDHWTVWRSFTLTLKAQVDEPQPEPVTGDVTGDGECDVEDYRALQNAILDLTAYDAALDVNHDGVVDVADVTAVTNIILYGQWWGQGPEPTAGQNEPQVRSNALGVNTLRRQADAISMVNASEAFNAFQMDIAGATAESIRLGGAAAGHDLAVRQLPDGGVRVVVTSPTNAAFGQGTLLYVNAGATLSNVIFANASAKHFFLGDDATGISALSVAAAAATFYDLGGRQTSQLRSGVNIVRQADGTTVKVIRK